MTLPDSADLRQVRRALVSEVGLDAREADLYLLITVGGRMSVVEIAAETGLPESECAKLCTRMTELGAFIEMAKGEFEAMHPRFTAVNMYRRICEMSGLRAGRNKTVDGIGAALEPYYDAARTK